ncbi:MAG: PP2C family protein-serine/threonine phosphatase [Solirubrobacteraceae bacterium]
MTPGESAPKRRPWWIGLPAAALIVGLAATAALALLSEGQYTRNQQRLLTLRMHDAAALLTAALPSLETPLASTAALADATNGNVSRFTRFAAPLVHGPTAQFASVSLWLLAAPRQGPVAVAGTRPKLAALPAKAAAALFTRATRTRTLTVVGLLSEPSPRLGYAFVTRGAAAGFAAYAEAPLPADHRSPLQGSSAFAGLNYALYLGRSQKRSDLLLTNLGHPPAPDSSDAQTVPFGDSELTLVMSSQASLAGTLPQLLPWIIAAVGLALSLAASLLTLRLVERRRAAEGLASELDLTARENRRLYAEQRDIAQTLQHALLPADLPSPDGVQTSGRYEASQEGVEIGGDWYDVIEVGDGGLLMVVGDVSGHGLGAATTMAELRFAIRAYAADGDGPERILTKLSGMVSVAEGGQLATVVCALLEQDAGRVTLASAGHLPPLLLANGDASFLETEVGPPLGVQSGADYSAHTFDVPASATLVGYTDGLVELRNESLDQSLERLRTAAGGEDAELPELLDRLVKKLPAESHPDDIAIVGVRWTAKRTATS